MAAISRLSLDGYGARRAGSFANKALLAIPLDRIVYVLAEAREVVADAILRTVAVDAASRTVTADATDRGITV